jgi:AcrR family transcriptional regulator
MTASAPPLKELQHMLAGITERLAQELAAPGAEAPRWNDTEWDVARAVAAVHGVSGLLARRLRWQGPQPWRDFLEDQHAQVAQRQEHIAALLARIDAHARERNLALVGLKGAALLALELYEPGERPMADVDLLVEGSREPVAQELLLGLGFNAGAVTWKHRTYAQPDAARAVAHLGEHSNNPLKIELHREIAERLPLRPVDITAQVLGMAAGAGLRHYPSRAALLLHVLLHAAGAMVDRTARLLHLSDIARLSRTLQAADWEELLTLGGPTERALWWAFPPLALTQRYFRCLPPQVLARLSRQCRWPLRHAARHRRLADVSLSYLWVSAFPGIEWSGSPAEAAAYALRRVRPRAETLALRRAFAQSQPLISDGEWAHASQGRRILRWLSARQPRQEALQPVRAALRRLPPGSP